jgi:hypothetical protein
MVDFIWPNSAFCVFKGYHLTKFSGLVKGKNGPGNRPSITFKFVFSHTEVSNVQQHVACGMWHLVKTNSETIELLADIDSKC